MHPTTSDGGESLTVHQLLRQLAPAYLERFGSSMPGWQRQVLKKILSCRTPALGGQLFECPDCPGFHYRYHSCNDRHCPQCGQTDADAWLERQGARLLLPVPYFFPANGALGFIGWGGPAFLGQDRPGKPAHIQGEVVQATQEHIRRDRAGFEHP